MEGQGRHGGRMPRHSLSSLTSSDSTCDLLASSARLTFDIVQFLSLNENFVSALENYGDDEDCDEEI